MSQTMNQQTMNRKNWQNLYHTNVNVDLTKESVILINSGIKINVDTSVKNMYVKKVALGILLPVVVKMENI